MDTRLNPGDPGYYRWRSCISKKRYEKYKLAANKAALMKRDKERLLDVYKCKFCKGFHLTTRQEQEQEEKDYEYVHLPYASNVPTGPAVPSVPVQNESTRDTAKADCVDHVASADDACSSKTLPVEKKMITLTVAQKVAFRDHLLRLGFKKSTAITYAWQVNKSKSSIAAYDKWLASLTQASFAPPVETTKPADVQAQSFGTGEYLIKSSADGFKIVNVTQRVPYEQLEQELTAAKAELETYKDAAQKWSALQAMLTTGGAT